MWIDFNINDMVRVKLTDLGRQTLWANHLNTFGSRVIDFPYSPPKEDEEGWSRWQLWVLMSDLGGAMRMGADNPFCTQIQFEIPDNQPETGAKR